jgi:ABC-type antimicrobial peptide transport system permease subunit
LALVLSVVGLYAVIAYAAKEHRRDVAIRMALGATEANVTRFFLRQAIILLAGGLAVGAVGGRFLGAALAGQLHGVEPDDPATLIAGTALLSAAALVAVWLPARRAAGESPMAVLREE